MDQHKQTQRAKERTINTAIGKRIRVYRRKNDLSQRDVGDYLGVTFQQVQKWERGTNRISAARLRMLCFLFDITLEQFFFQT